MEARQASEFKRLRKGLGKWTVIEFHGLSAAARAFVVLVGGIKTHVDLKECAAEAYSGHEHSRRNETRTDRAKLPRT